MRINRTPEEWRALFDEQQRSGLTQTQFCRLHAITRSAFSNARCRLSASAVSTASFIPTFPPEPDACTSTPSDTASPKNVPGLSPTAPQLALVLPGATLSLPVDTSPLWLATLLREMTR
ncbi:IS66 family insertion sequence element accessory protein TnpA [Klebsiella michiganensis]|uniref:IS66 family insertion sequence element accessory protein TnpA n=1 Tax=Klebsiella michiganensis TaxID=1134687 RepID=UPI003877F643